MSAIRSPLQTTCCGGWRLAGHLQLPILQNQHSIHAEISTPDVPRCSGTTRARPFLPSTACSSGRPALARALAISHAVLQSGALLQGASFLSSPFWEPTLSYSFSLPLSQACLLLCTFPSHHPILGSCFLENPN